MTHASIHLIAAARPNFMKVAPLYHALWREQWAKPTLVHTGQHYDPQMSEFFFRDLGLPDADFHLGVGSGSHAQQTAAVMVAYEKVCQENRPDWIVVVGDVNSTLAAALVGKKLCLPVAHLEAGLRSGDRTMPEEINRLATDAISDVLWTPSADADANLIREGIPAQRITCVGNVMIDAYELMRERIENDDALETYGLAPGKFGVITLHRPANVDDRGSLEKLLVALSDVGRSMPLIFPVHPRTRARIAEFGLMPLLEQSKVRLTEPLGYIRFMSLVSRSAMVITDSGGVQEETTYLGIPCLTLRDTTERPITVTEGTNRLTSSDKMAKDVQDALEGRWPKGRCPALWDGRAASRVVESLRLVCQ